MRVNVVIQREENIIDKCEVATIGKMVFTIVKLLFTIEIMMNHLTIGKTSFTIYNRENIKNV